MKRKVSLLDKLDQSLEAKPVASPAPASRSAPDVSSAALVLRPRANELIYRSLPWVVGAGLIPIPWLDVAGVVALQVRLLRDLSRLYGVPFSEHRAKAVAAALVGGALPKAMAGSAVGLAVGLAPLANKLVGTALFPLAAAASTLAIGRMFAAHFESRGNWIDVDTDKLKANFKDEIVHAGRSLKNGASSLARELKAHS